jgi:hypothetical protein
VYEPALSGIKAGGTVTAGVTKSGYTITPASQQAAVYQFTAPGDIAESFSGLTADGSSTATTTKLTLTFDQDIAGLGAGDITLTANGTGAAKGTLTRTNTGVYELALSGITASGAVTAGVAKSGYAITPTSRQATVYAAGSAGITVVFTGLPQDEAIDLGAAQTLSWNENTALTVTASGFKSYQWYLDGNVLSGETGSGITLYGGDCRIGQHRLAVQAGKGGAYYSKTVNFTVDITLSRMVSVPGGRWGQATHGVPVEIIRSL